MSILAHGRCGVAWIMFCGVVLTIAGPATVLRAADPIAEGQTVPNAIVMTQTGVSQSLSEVIQGKPTVLVILRGYPGYQCPICRGQVADLVSQSKSILKTGYQVVFVYPGPGSRLLNKAGRFFRDFDLPDGFSVVLDPDYTLSNAFGIRWDVARETVYPTTLVLSPERRVLFRKTSASHGNRVTASALRQVLRGLQ